MKSYNKTIFECSKIGRKAYTLPSLDVPKVGISQLESIHALREEDNGLPEVFEVEVIRHYTNLSNKNYGVDTGFYPLGSCTMKYNPKINEDLSGIEGFTETHPFQPEKMVQGNLQLMYQLQELLEEITGMNRITLQPAAGSQGELTGLMLIKAFHQKYGGAKRDKIIVPDSAHGTNPASASMAGFKVIEIKSNKEGTMDLKALEEVLDETVAGLMLTNPNTLGIFEKDIKVIADKVHNVGGLLYYDGANMNANMGITRPGDMGFDVVHLNLHKTFSTPHGGGGPGSGPVGVVEKLAEFLPLPYVVKEKDDYRLQYNQPSSIGAMKCFYGNFNVLLKAYSYIRFMGADGLKRASQLAVLNANYLKESLKNEYILPVEGLCKHEFVLGGIGENEGHVTTLDLAKRMIDYGIHPPTIYFPLIVDSALMIEPTETESKETLDEYIEMMLKLKEEALNNSDNLKNAPLRGQISRLDEVKAARNLILSAQEE